MIHCIRIALSDEFPPKSEDIQDFLYNHSENTAVIASRLATFIMECSVNNKAKTICYCGPYDLTEQNQKFVESFVDQLKIFKDLYKKYTFLDFPPFEDNNRPNSQDANPLEEIRKIEDLLFKTITDYFVNFSKDDPVKLIKLFINIAKLGSVLPVKIYRIFGLFNDITNLWEETRNINIFQYNLKEFTDYIEKTKNVLKQTLTDALIDFINEKCDCIADKISQESFQDIPEEIVKNIILHNKWKKIENEIKGITKKLN